MELNTDQKYAALTDTLEDCATCTLDLGGNVTAWSSNAEVLNGYRADEVLGRNASIFYTAEDVRDGLPVLALETAARDGRQEAETWRIRKDGTRVWAHCVVVSLKNSSGEITGFFQITRDVAGHKPPDAARHLEIQIQHAQKLETLGLLACGIAHDFNNLLVSILGYSGLALMELPPEAPARGRVQMIETAAIRAAELTNQLLAYSGKGAFVIQPVNLSRLVDEMSHLLSLSFSKKITFRAALSDDLPCVEADAAQLQQVVMNLITNASEAIGDKIGSISVRTGVTHLNREYFWRTGFEEDLPDGDYVFLEVADTGSGIDPETRPHIFDPFFTTKFTGHGLGLSAVRGIVRDHRGAINLYSEIDQGTTFRVILPVIGKTTAPALAPPEERAAAWRGTGAVLVIDDEEGVRILVREALEECGLTILTAEDGGAGLRIFRERASEISVVLLDMTMPHMSGEEVFDELTRISPDVRVIISSGNNEQDTASVFAGARYAAFIQKPYQPLALIEKIRATLESAGQPHSAGIQEVGGSVSAGV